MRKVCRLVNGEPQWFAPEELGPKPAGTPKAMECYSLGCIAQQVDELRADAKLHGFTAVEFREDRSLPLIDGKAAFYNCYCDSPDQAERYGLHRNLPNKSGVNGAGAILYEDHIQRMQRKMLEKYPVRGARV